MAEKEKNKETKAPKPAREKRTKLHPWQKVITQEEYVKKVQEGVFGVGYFKPTSEYYEVDQDNAEYAKHLEAKKQVKKDKKAKQAEIKTGLRKQIKDLKDEVKTLKRDLKKQTAKAGNTAKLAKEAAKIQAAEDRLAARKKKAGLQ